MCMSRAERLNANATGDAAKIVGSRCIRLANGNDAEILVFDLP